MESKQLLPDVSAELTLPTIIGIVGLIVFPPVAADMVFFAVL